MGLPQAIEAPRSIESDASLDENNQEVQEGELLKLPQAKNKAGEESRDDLFELFSDHAGTWEAAR